MLKKNSHFFYVFLNKNVFVISVALATLVGCSHQRPQKEGGAIGAVIRESDSGSSSTTNPTTKVSSGKISSKISEVLGKKLENTNFDYPVIQHPKVEQWIRYFTGKGKKYFEKYLERGRYFIPEISKVLRAHNMPQDLVYLAMIESGFNNSARSRARAVGPWQFIRGTGSRYGLRIDFWLDERRDTKKSTLAAIAYLKELHQEFGSWELAAAGYNAGEGKVRRAIKKYKTTDFWEISRHRFFKPETRDYVPKIMAAAILTKNPELFGFEDAFKRGGIVNPTVLAAEDSENSTSSEEVTPKELGEPIAKVDDVEEDAVDKEKDAEDSSDTEVASDEDSDDSAVLSQTPSPSMTPSIYMVANPNEQILEFEIKGPSDLFAISKASGLPYSTIKMLNPELTRWCTPPDMKTYRIKLPLSVKDRFLSTYNDESFDRKVVFLQYTVKRGDSLSRIAKRFSTETGIIREINRLPAATMSVKVGSQISLPVPTGHKRVIASMYDDKPLPPVRKRRSYRRSRRAPKAALSDRHSSKARQTRIRKHSRIRPRLMAAGERAK